MAKKRRNRELFFWGFLIVCFLSGLEIGKIAFQTRVIDSWHVEHTLVSDPGPVVVSISGVTFSQDGPYIRVQSGLRNDDNGTQRSTYRWYACHDYRVPDFQINRSECREFDTQANAEQYMKDQNGHH
jgi:hypothetical protein